MFGRRRIPSTLKVFTVVGSLLPSLADQALAESQHFRNVHISAQSSIFVPCGGKQGLFRLQPAGPNEQRMLSFDKPVVGSVSCCGFDDFGGPDGSEKWIGGEVGTDITGEFGISGIRHDDHKMFLAGVFVNDNPCNQTSPPNLRFTSSVLNPAVARGEAILDSFFSFLSPSRLTPLLNQSFYIGDGWGLLGRQEFVVPPEATGLRLGFVDGCNFGSGADPEGCPRPAPPCCYPDNEGSLLASFSIESMVLVRECEPDKPIGQQGCGDDGLCVQQGLQRKCVGCKQESDCPDGRTCVAGTCVHETYGFCDAGKGGQLSIDKGRACNAFLGQPTEAFCQDSDSCQQYDTKSQAIENCIRAYKEYVRECFRNVDAPNLDPGTSKQREAIQKLQEEWANCEKKKLAIKKRESRCSVFVEINRKDTSPAECRGVQTAVSRLVPCAQGRKQACDEASTHALAEYAALHFLRGHPPYCSEEKNYETSCIGGTGCPRP